MPRSNRRRRHDAASRADATNHELIATAYHEAAHLVVAVAMGLGPATLMVSARPPADGFAGVVSFKGDILLSEAPDDMERMMRTAFAGRAAETRLGVTSATEAAARAAVDDAIAESFAAVLDLDPDAFITLEERLRAEVVEIVDARWESISRVADALVEHGALSAEDALRYIE